MKVVRSVRQAGLIPALLAGAAVAMGLALLAGWVLDRLPTPTPNPIASTCITLLGVGVLLALGSSHAARVAAMFCATTSVLVGLTRLIAYLAGWEIPLDLPRLLDGRVPSVVPISPSGALCLMLEGVALLLLLTRGRRSGWAIQLCAGAALLLSLLSGLEYLLTMQLLDGQVGIRLSRLESSVGAFLAAMAIFMIPATLWSQPPDTGAEGEDQAALERSIRVGFAVAMVAMCLMAGGSYISLNQLLLDTRADEHTQMVLVAVADVQAALGDAETTQRGYIITGDEAFLEPYRRALSRCTQLVERLRDLTADNQVQQERLTRLATMVRRRFATLDQVADIRESEGLEAARQTILASDSAQQMDAIRDLLGEIRETEEVLLSERSAATTLSARRSLTTIYLGSLVGFLVVGFAGMLVRRNVLQNRRANRKFRDLVESSPDPMVITDHSGNIVLVNSQTLQLFGYAREELLGRPVEILVPERFREVHPQQREAYFANPQPRPMGAGRQLFALRKDGTEFPAEISLSPIQTEEGVLISSSIRDITARLKIEQTLQQKNVELREASRAKDRFLANMSHEIRTPLHGVIGMLNLLLSTQLGHVQARYVRLAKASAESLTTIINDILDLSKISAGKLEIQSIPFNLPNVLEDVTQMLAPKALEKKLELICHADSEVPQTVVGDPDRLRQVLVNLVSNAIKFTEQGTVSVTVGPQVTAAPSRDVVVLRFSVNDTGIGIARDRHARLFKSFSQAEESTTRYYGGTGLGLAISKQLVELMGGSIGVHSEVGRGSTFWFVLPLRSVGPAARFEQYSLDGRKLRVLVVDDNVASCEALRMQLQSWGMEVEATNSSDAAVRTLYGAAMSGNPFQVALIDEEMPGRDGHALARQIKSREEMRPTVLLLMVAMDREHTIERLEELGFAGQITKPVRQSQLFDTIVTVLAGHMPTTDAAASTGSQEAPAEETSPPAADARILIAEDNEINQIVVSDLLRYMGYHCTVVSNGSEAVEAVLREGYDLVLMDCQMPIMDGFAATRAIRAAEAAEGPIGRGERPIPIIALTANAVTGDRDRCLEAGMDDYIPKPMSPQRLHEILRQYLGNGERAASDEAESEPQGSGEPNGPPFELEQLMANYMRDASTVSNLIHKFNVSLQQDIGRIEEALSRQDAQEVRRLAHGLKGVGSYLCCPRVRDVSARMEDAALVGDLSGTAGGLAELRKELQRCEAYERDALAQDLERAQRATQSTSTEVNRSAPN